LNSNGSSPSWSNNNNNRRNGSGGSWRSDNNDKSNGSGSSWRNDKPKNAYGYDNYSGGNKSWDNSRSNYNKSSGNSYGGYNKRWENDKSSGYGYKGNYSNKPNNYGQKSYQKVRPPTQEEKANLPVVEKNFYVASAVTKNRSSMEIKKFLAANNITISNGTQLNPILTFSEATFPENLQQKLLGQGFDKPTMIQSLTWPYAQAGRDLIGIAKTGSGKTLAFLLPALVHITSLVQVHDRQGCKPIALVMLPTRELAQQVESEVTKFAPRGFRYTCVYGGSPRNHQQKMLRYGCDLLVATPGRLIDFLESGDVNLTACSYLVLDEADRMLDMGFEPQIRQILDFMRPDRQTLMWSATWPQKIRKLAQDFLQNPVHFQVGSTELTANHDIKQNVIVLKDYEKYDQTLKLMEEITATPDHKTIIFTETKKKCQQVADQLWNDSFNVECIHGGKSQDQRDRAIRSFRSGEIPVLVATDVASRGIDVVDVRHIVNYDFPKDIESYVQRIGRTARAGQKGTSHSYFTRKDSKLAGDLIRIMEEAGQQVESDLRQFQRYSGGYSSGGGYSSQGRSYSQGGYGGYQRKKDYVSPFDNVALGGDEGGFIMTSDGPVMRPRK